MFDLFKQHVPRVSDEHRARVRKGAALLDKRAPGWEKNINTRTLNIASTHNCALGQTYGSYFVGAVVAGVTHTTKEHGFQANGWNVDVDAEYRALTEAWKAEVYDRRKKELV